MARACCAGHDRVVVGGLGAVARQPDHGCRPSFGCPAAHIAAVALAALAHEGAAHPVGAAYGLRLAALSGFALLAAAQMRSCRHLPASMPCRRRHGWTHRRHDHPDRARPYRPSTKASRLEVTAYLLVLAAAVVRVALPMLAPALRCRRADRGGSRLGAGVHPLPLAVRPLAGGQPAGRQGWLTRRSARALLQADPSLKFFNASPRRGCARGDAQRPPERSP